MTSHIEPTDLKMLDATPRVLDLRLAEALSFEKPYDIRKLIARNEVELAKHGGVFATVAKTSPSGGRPTNEFWLNEAQSLLICMFSRTDRAAEVRAEIIKVFMAWRQGQLGGPLQGAASPFEFPADPLGVQSFTAKVDAVRVAMRLKGNDAGYALWHALGLPPLPGCLPPVDGDEAQRCLAHLLGTKLAMDRTLGQWIAVALDVEADSDTRRQLKGDGIIIVDDGDAEVGFVLANTHPHISGLFAGTPWKETYPYVLRRLPGVRVYKRLHYGLLQRRGTFVPASLLEPPPAAPPSNVVPLH